MHEHSFPRPLDSPGVCVITTPVIFDQNHESAVSNYNYQFLPPRVPMRHDGLAQTNGPGDDVSARVCLPMTRRDMPAACAPVDSCQPTQILANHHLNIAISRHSKLALSELGRPSVIALEA
ncbi:hypothetical protein QTP88_025935 [Uroleucon formosanum]